MNDKDMPETKIDAIEAAHRLADFCLQGGGGAGSLWGFIQSNPTVFQTALKVADAVHSEEVSDEMLYSLENKLKEEVDRALSGKEGKNA